MGFLDVLRARAPKRKSELEGISSAALPEGGRSSRESPQTILTGLRSYMSWWDGVEPALPPAYLDFLERMAVINPDMSQAVTNWVSLGNPGHELVVVGGDEAVAAAHRRLNAKAQMLGRHTAGIDGLVNQYLEQVAVTGAISSEDVVVLGSDPGVREVVLVPPAQIRFKREDDAYVPVQTLDGEDHPLNAITYRYYAYTTFAGSPYAKPPMIAAIEPILDQHSMKKNLQFILKKFGLFGLVSAAVTPPAREPGETREEYRHRSQAYLGQVLEAFKQNFHEGLAVFSDDIKVERTNLTTDARGVQDIFRLNEEQLFSGLGTDPAMHGRTYSTTETYARVVYNLLLRQAESFQRPVKRRIERTYRLDLALAGIRVEDVSLYFQKAESRDPLNEARARQVAWQTIREKVEAGLLDPDSAARELGHDSWYDVRPMAASGDTAAAMKQTITEQLHRFRYDRGGQRYRYIRPGVVWYRSTDVKRNGSVARNGGGNGLPERKPAELTGL